MKRARATVSGRRLQGGYMLLGALLALVVFASIMAVGIQWANRHMLEQQAAADGAALGQFAVGLRGFAAAAQANPGIIPGSARVGVNWLKPPSCGGLATNPAEGYVPCSFTGGRYGANYRTTFTYTGATGQLEARTTYDISAAGYDRPSAGRVASLVVRAALSQQSNPNNGVFFMAYANAPSNLAAAPTPSDPVFYNPGTNEGRVTAVVTNAPSNDIFLRTDGTNRMLANLNMGGHSIGNARDARFQGRVQIDQGMTVTNGTADFRQGVVTTDVSLTSIQRAASQGIYDAEVKHGAASYTIAKPNCAQAGNRPAIYAAIQSTGTVNHAGYQADAMYESRVDVIDNGSNWTVRPVVRGTRFDVTADATNIYFSRNLVEVNPQDMRILVMTRCK